jgi:hypothetical protein
MGRLLRQHHILLKSLYVFVVPFDHFRSDFHRLFFFYDKAPGGPTKHSGQPVEASGSLQAHIKKQIL